jgi:hypothetical protein
MGWKNRLTALFLIPVPPTKVEGAHERIGLVSGFFSWREKRLGGYLECGRGSCHKGL